MLVSGFGPEPRTEEAVLNEVRDRCPPAVTGRAVAPRLFSSRLAVRFLPLARGSLSLRLLLPHLLQFLLQMLCQHPRRVEQRLQRHLVVLARLH